MKEKRPTAPPKLHDALLTELRGLIEAARQYVAQTANATLTMQWHRIDEELLKKEHAPYGQEIVSAVSTELTQDDA
jgi:hypothetical protein